MKQILKTSLIFVFFLGIIFPKNVSIGKQSNNIPTGSQVYAVKTSADIVVGNATQFGEIGLVKNQAVYPAEDCQIKANQQSLPLQNANIANLNLPANCFSLKVESQAVFSSELSVKPLIQPVTFVQVFDRTVLENWSWESLPQASSIPVLPGILFVFTSAILVGARKKLSLKLKSLGQMINENKNPIYMQVLNC